MNKNGKLTYKNRHVDTLGDPSGDLGDIRRRQTNRKYRVLLQIRRRSAKPGVNVPWRPPTGKVRKQLTLARKEMEKAAIRFARVIRDIEQTLDALETTIADQRACLREAQEEKWLS